MNTDQILDLIKNKSGLTKKILAFFFIFQTIHGTIGFAEFIYEEAMQTAMFAAFSYQSAEDWNGLKQHLQVMKKTQATGEFFIRYIGWLAPLMWPAYLNYLENNAAYIKATERRIISETSKAKLL